MNLKRLHNDLHEGALQLIAEHRVQLFAKAKALCGNSSDADELVIRTIDQAIRKIGTYTGEGDILSWMMAILVNLHNHDHRSPVVRNTLAVGADELEKYAGADWATDEEILRNSDSEAIRKAISELDPKYNQVLMMRYYEEFSLKQIADILRLPLGTVCRRVQIAHRLLAGKLSGKLGKAKKPLMVLLAALLGIGALFGAWVSPLGDWVAEKVLGNTTPVTASVSVGETVSEAGEADKKAAEPNVATPTNGNSISETPKQEGETNMNISAKIKKTVATAAVAAVGLVGSASATTWYVSQSGSADNDGKSWETARLSIWDTYFNAAQPGDTILVGAGTWAFTITWDFNRGITIKGFGDHETIISGDDKVCPVKMNHKDFVLENVVIERGAIDGAASTDWKYPAAGVDFVAGTLRDCIVRYCHPLKEGCNASAVHFEGVDSGTTMLMTGCLIVSNHLGTSNAAYGAVDVTKGKLTVIDNCEIAYNTGRAAVGLFLECFATAKNCVIHDNVGLPSGQLDKGVTGGNGGGARVEDGILQNCIITNNSCGRAGGGVWMRGGTLENCLVACNHADGDAASGDTGGVYVNAGSTALIRFCNIGGNTSGVGSGAGVCCSGSGVNVTCVNDIIWGNGADPSKEVSGGTYSYCYLPVSKSGTGNIVGAADPYQDAANGDYLTVRSADFAGVDKAQEISGVAKDLKGTDRPLDGDGDGTAKSDIGCVEFNPRATDAAAYLTTPLDEVVKGDVVTFTLQLEGFGAGTKVVWNFGDGSEPEETGPVSSQTHVFAAAGSNAVHVVVTDAADHRAEATVPPICVLPNEVFVSATGGNVWPYDTPEKAAVSYGTARKYVRAPSGDKGYVTFLPGVFEIDWTIEVQPNWVVRGSGWRQTTIVQTSRYGAPMVTIADRTSVVSNLVLSGGYTLGTTSDQETAPSGVKMTAGLLVDCELTGCTVAAGGRAGNALGLVGSGDNCPEARNCLITGNNCFIGPAADGTYPRGAAVYLKGVARLVDCEVAYNTGRGGVYAMMREKGPVVIEGCNIHHNETDILGGGVLMQGGLIRNSRIADNKAGGSAGGLAFASTEGTTAINCLIIRNVAKGTGGGCEIRDCGAVFNCTVADNVSETGAGGIWLRDDTNTVSASTVCNTIVWGNRGVGASVEQQHGSVLYSCLQEALDDAAFTGNKGNAVADPKFFSVAAEDYRPASGSPCIDAASTDAIAAAATVTEDLVGTARPLDGNNDGVAAPDIGCYEVPYSAEPQAYASVLVSVPQAESGTAVGFTAALAGAEGSPETQYVWDFADGTVVTNVGVATASHIYRLAGMYPVTVAVTDESTGIDLVSRPLAFDVISRTVYVAPEGDGVYPYDSPERATSDWAAALAAAQGHAPTEPVELRLVEGVHRVGTMTLRGKLTVSGAGVGKTVVDVGTGAGLVLNGSDVVLRNLTVSNFNHTAVTVTNGTVSGCGVTCGWPRTATDEVHGIWLAGEHNGDDKVCLVSNCVVTSVMATNVVAMMPATADGAGVRIDKDGWLVDTTVRGCRCDFGPAALKAGTEDKNVGYGGGLFVRGNSRARIERCTFENNFARLCGGGVYVFFDDNATAAYSASIVNCRIVRNSCFKWAGAGLRTDGTSAAAQASALVAGCLIAENNRIEDATIDAGSAAGAYVINGRLVNCTIAGNRGGTYAAGIFLAKGANNTLVNSIVWDNETWSDRKKDENRGAELVTEADTSVAQLIVGEGRSEIGGTPTSVWTDDPKFRTETYFLKANSPARERGVASAWRAESLPIDDYYRHKRLSSPTDETLNLGAFADYPFGLVIFFQ